MKTSALVFAAAVLAAFLVGGAAGWYGRGAFIAALRKAPLGYIPFVSEYSYSAPGHPVND